MTQPLRMAVGASASSSADTIRIHRAPVVAARATGNASQYQSRREPRLTGWARAFLREGL